MHTPTPTPAPSPAPLCDYCGRRIDGEVLAIVPLSDSGARPTVYWHRDHAECARPRPISVEDTVLQRRLRRRP
ncbi:hypothetical protein AB0E83_03020 [Streptomyces sp. NPDC035033]|uniref:hypothetical protein n=1 Tax=Streptomyces sp. NPDC035033 TaxID=3155368 RepID=UPI0033EBCD18